MNEINRDWFNRLIDEHNELEEKTNKLAEFLLSVAYNKLSKANRILLKEQWKVMDTYKDVLKVRIELNKPNE